MDHLFMGEYITTILWKIWWIFNKVIKDNIINMGSIHIIGLLNKNTNMVFLQKNCNQDQIMRKHQGKKNWGHSIK